MSMKLQPAIFVALCCTVLGAAPMAAPLDKEPDAAAPSDPIPMGRDVPPRHHDSGMTIKNNSAPDHAPGVDTGSKVPIPNDRNGMVDTPPPANADGEEDAAGR